MAERPIFVPDNRAHGLVRETLFSITLAGGVGAAQKKENIKALHEAAAAAGFTEVLEISTKSDEPIGQKLSAFNLTFGSEAVGDIPLECFYQGSKVFEHGGPFIDLYEADVRDVKRDVRLKKSGRLTCFLFDGFQFPIDLKTAFYDWLYINTIFQHREWIRRDIHYCAFTDIEFNPARSIACQARSFAMFMSLLKMKLLDEGIRDPSHFIALARKYARCEGE